MKAPPPERTTTHGSALDSQAAALLERVASDREQRCTALRNAADLQAHQIVAAARTLASANVRNAIIEERSRIEQGLRQATARAEIEARKDEQRESQVLLQRMWLDVADVIERRWSDLAQRQAWIEGAVAVAAILLAGRPWRIESDPSWTDSERGRWSKYAVDKGAGAVEWTSSSSVHAGLKIRTDFACIDATVPGLLVQRDAIESAFLAEYLLSNTAHPSLRAAPGPPS
ncbi:MAG: hypothetical protein ABJC66_08765 [Gammaproteobacteria bacterium]